MSDLRFGWTYRGVHDLDMGDFAALAEELGFHSIWVGEHIANWPGRMTVVPVLGAFAARTKRITIGSSVLLLPLRAPGLIAKELAIIDLLSRGRLAVGVGIGGENPADFAACGVPIAERAGRTNEALEIILRLWREPEVTYRGKYFTLEGLSIDPKPVQPGGPPIYVAGRKEGAIQRAARYGNGFMPYFYTPEQYAKALLQLERFAVEANRDPSSFDKIVCVFITVADSKDEARRIAINALGWSYGQDLTNMIDKYCALGTPADCVARLGDYVDAGARHIVFLPALARESIADQMSVVAKEILPAFT